MANASTGGAALGGLVFATVLGVLVVGAISWAGGSYYYGRERLKVRDRVLAMAEPKPTRLPRALKVECNAGGKRTAAEKELDDIGRFDLGKVHRFQGSPTDQRARELGRTSREMEPAIALFLDAADCTTNDPLPRGPNDLHPTGEVIARGVLVGTWLGNKVSRLKTLGLVGRDIQSSGDFYAFREGTSVLETSYIGIGHALATGRFDDDLEGLAAHLALLSSNEEEAQLVWRAGARQLLSQVLGPDWDSTPPTPLQAKAMLESMDAVLGSMEKLPVDEDKSYADRHTLLKEWVETHDMDSWHSKFQGFGRAGLKADERATMVHSRGRALVIAVALRRFQQRRRYCPRSLEELVESEYLASIPSDPIANAPFEYEREACRLRSGTAILSGESVSVSATAFP